MKPFLLVSLAGLSFTMFAASVQNSVATELAKRCLPAKNTCIYDAAFDAVCRADRAADAAWLAVKTPEGLMRRQHEVREAALAALGGFPERTPLNVRVVGRFAREGYSVEKILFESRPFHYVTALLFIPDPARFAPPYPGIVVTCGHSENGKGSGCYQRGALQAAKAGMAALICDPIDQGERVQFSRKRWNCVAHNQVGARALLLGWNTASFRIWDGLRALDVLAERSDIDSKRLGVMGHSGGGTLSAFIAALDPRVACAAPSGFLTTLRDVCKDCGPQDAEQNFYGQLTFGLNHLGLILLRAPSPLLHVSSHADFFPFIGVQATSERAHTVFDRFGRGDRFGLFDASGPHHWHESSRTASVSWMRRWLRNETGVLPLDLPALRRLDIGFSYETVDCGLAAPNDRVTSGGDTRELPGARTVYDLMRDELARVRVKRPPLTPASVRSVTGIRPLAALDAVPIKLSDSKTTDGVTVTRTVLSRMDDEIPVPVITFTPAARSTASPVLLVSDSSDRTDLAPRVAALLSEGRTVSVADLRACGETSVLIRPYYGCKRADEAIAVLYQWLGQSLAARRTEDLLIAARFVSAAAGGRSIDLIAEDGAGIPAAHARYLEKDLFSEVSLTRPPAAWSDLLTDDAAVCRFAGCVHGALRTYDWTDLMKESTK